MIGLLAWPPLVSGYRVLRQPRRGQGGVAARAGPRQIRAPRPARPRPRPSRRFPRISGGSSTTYGSRSNGSIARLLYANLCYEAGDFTQAAELYKACLEPICDQPLIRFQILKSLGYTYEGLKDRGGGDATLKRRLAAGDKRLQDDVLFRSGGLYATAGREGEEREAFRAASLCDHQRLGLRSNLVRTESEANFGQWTEVRRFAPSGTGTVQSRSVLRAHLQVVLLGFSG